MGNIFKDAKFGDKFRTRNNQMALYINVLYNRVNLIMNSEFYGLRYITVYRDGLQRNGKETDYDIVARWEEQINDVNF